MKQRILLPLGVLAALFAFCLWNTGRMDAHSLRWRTQLQISGTCAQAGDWSAALDTLSESHRDWSRQQTYLHMVTGHGAVDEAETLYRRCLAFAAAREDSEFFAELASLQEQIRLLAEMELLSCENVF